MNINQVWPEWNEDCVLGEGSFGKVYRAKRVEYGRTFYSAIKVLTVPKSQQEVKHARSQGMTDEDICRYFRSIVDNLLDEITLMDNLKGAKNIVGIEDYKIIEHEGEIGWDIFIRMELLTPFDSFVSNPEFTQKDVIRLGVDICTALENCEQNHVVHRDIKPDNIFISRFGEYKLGDFGIARKLEATQANLSRKGTLNFMAPEVYKSEQYGSNVDIYSLGMVLYTLLNNNRIAFLPPYPQPITYKDNELALSRRLSGEPLCLPCNASSSLGNVILKACAYNPLERYQTATEFKNALILEWNALAQSGDNREIQSDAMRFVGDKAQHLQSTTNDMNNNGRVVVDSYSHDTTVLNQSVANEVYPQQGYEQPVQQGMDYSGQFNVSVPTAYSTAKSNGACRVFAWPLAVAVGVFTILQMVGGGLSTIEQIACVSILGLSVSVLLADTNRIALGLSVFALPLSYIVKGIGAFSGGGQAEFPIPAAVSLLSGALVLLGGVVILSQKEVRFGGSLLLYAVVIDWLFNIYQMFNTSYTFDLYHVFYGIAALAGFFWAYGYKSDRVITPFRMALHIVTYVTAASALAWTALMAIQLISAI